MIAKMVLSTNYKYRNNFFARISVIENRVCMQVVIAFQTQTKYCSQQASTVDSIYKNTALFSMSPAKEVTKNVGSEEKKELDNSSTKMAQELEAENEECPLQIDTSNEVKIDTTPETEQSKNEEGNVPINGTKRNSSTDSNPTPTKKVRPKPKPQMIENMKEYVDTNTIDKLTTTTLLYWLKERNLHCSTRDKKAELIQKVKNQFISSKS